MLFNLNTRTNKLLQLSIPNKAIHMHTMSICATA